MSDPQISSEILLKHGQVHTSSEEGTKYNELAFAFTANQNEPVRNQISLSPGDLHALSVLLWPWTSLLGTPGLLKEQPPL